MGTVEWFALSWLPSKESLHVAWASPAHPAQCNSADASHRLQLAGATPARPGPPCLARLHRGRLRIETGSPGRASRSCARSARPFGWSCSAIQATCRGAAGPLKGFDVSIGTDEARVLAATAGSPTCDQHARALVRPSAPRSPPSSQYSVTPGANSAPSRLRGRRARAKGRCVQPRRAGQRGDRRYRCQAADGPPERLTH